MNQLNRFYALSAIYFGLASAVGAQPQSTRSDTSASSVAEEPRQEKFKHPMLEPRHGNEVDEATDGPRIQRRGQPGLRQDGDIRRNVQPGAVDAGEPLRQRKQTDPSSPAPDR